MITHPIPPLFSADSKVLILGSFPSVKSREAAFFYGHPQNRFWKVIAGVYGEKIPQTIEEKKRLVLSNKLALWDVIAECEINGSSDSSIRNVKPNNLDVILSAADIKAIFVNGKTAEKYYIKYLENSTGRKSFCLPSTSPANAAWSVEKLTMIWSEVKKYTD